MTFSTNVFIILIAASFTVFFAGAQNQYKVGGDDQGWRVPDDNNSDFYTAWASKLRFQVGDTIRKRPLDLTPLLETKIS